jgi:hypothetical protein
LAFFFKVYFLSKTLSATKKHLQKTINIGHLATLTPYSSSAAEGMIGASSSSSFFFFSHSWLVWVKSHQLESVSARRTK